MRAGYLKGALVAFAVAVMTVVPTFASSWVLIGDGHYIDADSVKPAAQYGTYTMETEYLSRGDMPLEVINGKEIYTIKTTSYVDCRTNFAKTISYTALDRNNKAVITGNNVGKHWYGVNAPGSRAYESYAFVCTDKYLPQHRGYHNLWWY